MRERGVEALCNQSIMTPWQGILWALTIGSPCRGEYVGNSTAPEVRADRASRAVPQHRAPAREDRRREAHRSPQRRQQVEGTGRERSSRSGVAVGHRRHQGRDPDTRCGSVAAQVLGLPRQRPLRSALPRAWSVRAGRRCRPSAAAGRRGGQQSPSRGRATATATDERWNGIARTASRPPVTGPDQRVTPHIGCRRQPVDSSEHSGALTLPPCHLTEGLAREHHVTPEDVVRVIAVLPKANDRSRHEGTPTQEGGRQFTHRPMAVTSRSCPCGGVDVDGRECRGHAEGRPSRLHTEGAHVCCF